MMRRSRWSTRLSGLVGQSEAVRSRYWPLTGPSMSLMDWPILVEFIDLPVWPGVSDNPGQEYRVLHNNMHFCVLEIFDCSCLHVADCDHLSRFARTYWTKVISKQNNISSDYRYPQFPNHPAASSAVTASKARWISQGRTSGLMASLSCCHNHAFMKEKHSSIWLKLGE